MKATAVYIAEEFDVSALAEWMESDIYSLYIKENQLYYNDADLKLKDVHKLYNANFIK